MRSCRSPRQYMAAWVTTLTLTWSFIQELTHLKKSRKLVVGSDIRRLQPKPGFMTLCGSQVLRTQVFLSTKWDGARTHHLEFLGLGAVLIQAKNDKALFKKPGWKLTKGNEVILHWYSHLGRLSHQWKMLSPQHRQHHPPRFCIDTTKCSRTL